MKEKTSYHAPDFSLYSSDDKLYNLAFFSGKWLVLYFYPKDNTPGCTIEACSLRDSRDDLLELGAEVVGVSCDDASSHEKFKAKHTLNFILLSDPDKLALKAYGAWGKKQFGREGILRKTFIINPKGQVVKVYGKVTPINHGNQVFTDLKNLQKLSD